jgi:hypothetical protein
MLAVLGNYLQNLNSEIESYEQLIAQKREEAQKLSQLQGQVVEAIAQLKEVVDELRSVDPNAIATIQTATLQIFENGNGNGKGKDEGGKHQKEENPTASKPTPEASNFIRLSENVIYDPEKAIACAGINAYNRAKAWGEWLCFTHTVGDRFDVRNNSRSEGYNYDLVVFGIEPEDSQRLADADLTKQPHAPENASWQPLKRHPQAAPLRPPACQPGDLAVGDIARKDDGREYRIIGISDDGSIVKVVNDEGMEMAFSVGALYLVKKAEPEPEGNLARVTEAFSNGNSNGQSNGQGLEIGSPVIIRSSRYRGKYDGKKGAISTEPSTFGVKVDVGDGEPVFFLKDEVSLAA